VCSSDLSDAEAARVRMKVWDFIPYDDFINGHCSTPYQQRLLTLDNVNADGVVSVVESKLVYNEAETSELFLEALQYGLEGIMLKCPDVHWANERSQKVLKYKAENELDLLVVGVNPGKGKFEGMTGSLVCTTGDRRLVVNVSGFPDDLRGQFTSEYIVGKIVSVKYNEIIDSDGGDVKSLFLPRFVEVRLDKEHPDDLPQ
jgi:DNA ligase-1